MKTRQLKENIVYESKGYYYKTDELGRIKRAQGDMIEQVKDQKNLK